MQTRSRSTITQAIRGVPAFGAAEWTDDSGAPGAGTPRIARLVRLAIAVVALLVLVERSEAAPTAAPDAAVETGREALADQWDAPWYDAKTDSLKAIPVKAPKPAPPPAAPQEPWGFWEWLSGLFGAWNLDLGEIVLFLGWLALAALLVALIWALVRSIQTSDLADAQAEAERSAMRRRIESVEALPAPVASGVKDLLAESARLRDAGDLAGAIVYLFSHQLISLDHAGAIRLVKGKTNRQYLRELGRWAPAAAPLLAKTVDAFEASFFGGHTPTRQQFDACWEAALLLPAAATPAKEKAA
ncbi:hypothetical protein Pla175_50070 [Pirellulimonas nuda]|uniref:Protein-glutamine gamma-glutamyltransferase-like C-terminal domain-containing protein n=1 Tax=Pirellulimonas nuda TaxID=2528009 RepID=A0A518DJC5_9BACT|nr:DUF4129 domain-containing protein [Pirellulimonas nuda]QDU91577.1 hypothetical protein Pla175_50070 [Pirellulimonas nuda]